MNTTTQDQIRKLYFIKTARRLSPETKIMEAVEIAIQAFKTRNRQSHVPILKSFLMIKCIPFGALTELLKLSESIHSNHASELIFKSVTTEISIKNGKFWKKHIPLAITIGNQTNLKV